ncbi:hypothetical protein GCM10009850_064250 [Nonomuraea monospora]|uniref:Uncharacterized protein n=1 Tax=Nonomuraea monospora TaxID=568818 RepID=A0ABP5PIM2_9ACTN
MPTATVSPNAATTTCAGCRKREVSGVSTPITAPRGGGADTRQLGHASANASPDHPTGGPRRPDFPAHYRNRQRGRRRTYAFLTGKLPDGGGYLSGS